MKTITEFGSVQLKAAAQLKKNLMAAGKSPEELPQALEEELKLALKLEGDKPRLLVCAVELVESRLSDLKRVVVSVLNEGEKTPSHAQEKAGHYFQSEYYPPLVDKTKGKPFKGKKGPRGGKKRGPRARSPDGKPSAIVRSQAHGKDR